MLERAKSKKGMSVIENTRFVPGQCGYRILWLFLRNVRAGLSRESPTSQTAKNLLKT